MDFFYNKHFGQFLCGNLETEWHFGLTMTGYATKDGNQQIIKGLFIGPNDCRKDTGRVRTKGEYPWTAIWIQDVGVRQNQSGCNPYTRDSTSWSCKSYLNSMTTRMFEKKLQNNKCVRINFWILLLTIFYLQALFYSFSKLGGKLNLFGLFNIHTLRVILGQSCFGPLVWLCLEMIFYQCLQGSFTCHWGSNDMGPPL